MSVGPTSESCLVRFFKEENFSLADAYECADKATTAKIGVFPLPNPATLASLTAPVLTAILGGLGIELAGCSREVPETNPLPQTNKPDASESQPAEAILVELAPRLEIVPQVALVEMSSDLVEPPVVPREMVIDQIIKNATLGEPALELCQYYIDNYGHDSTVQMYIGYVYMMWGYNSGRDADLLNRAIEELNKVFDYPNMIWENGDSSYARAEFNIAVSLGHLGREEEQLVKLYEVVDEYPGTPSATNAQRLIETLTLPECLATFPLDCEPATSDIEFSFEGYTAEQQVIIRSVLGDTLTRIGTEQPCHVSGLNRIEIAANAADVTMGGAVVNGFYDRGPRILRFHLEPSDLEKTYAWLWLFLHEFGHHVDFEQREGIRLCQPFRDVSWSADGTLLSSDWGGFACEPGINQFLGSYSSSCYAMTDHREDFAESYKLYFAYEPAFRLRAEGNAAFSEKLAIMRDAYFGGVVFPQPWDQLTEASYYLNHSRAQEAIGPIVTFLEASDDPQLSQLARQLLKNFFLYSDIPTLLGITGDYAGALSLLRDEISPAYEGVAVFAEFQAFSRYAEAMLMRMSGERTAGEEQLNQLFDDYRAEVGNEFYDDLFKQLFVDLISIYNGRREGESALEICQLYIENFGHTAEIQEWVGYSYWRMAGVEGGDPALYDRAIEEYQAVFSLPADYLDTYAQAQYAIGLVYAEIGEIDQAISAFQTVIDDYADQPTYVNLARDRLCELIDSNGGSTGPYAETYSTYCAE